jgi:hypothetical protein
MLPNPNNGSKRNLRKESGNDNPHGSEKQNNVSAN